MNKSHIDDNQPQTLSESFAENLRETVTAFRVPAIIASIATLPGLATIGIASATQKTIQHVGQQAGFAVNQSALFSDANSLSFSAGFGTVLGLSVLTYAVATVMPLFSDFQYRLHQKRNRLAVVVTATGLAIGLGHAVLNQDNSAAHTAQPIIEPAPIAASVQMPNNKITAAQIKPA